MNKVQHEKTGRIEAIDVLKGILMVLVVFGHSIQFILRRETGPAHFEDPFFQVIYMFHMPLFMALSGFVSSRPRDFSNQLRKRIGVLLWPTVSWAILMGVLTVLVTEKSLVDTMAMMPDLLLMLWYLPCLFLSWVITIGLDHMCSRINPVLRVLPLLFSLIVLMLLPDKNICPYLKYTFPFFVLGFYFSKIIKVKQLGPTVKYYAALLSFVVFMLCFYLWKPDTYFYVSGFPLTLDGISTIVLRYASALSGSILLVSMVFIFQSATDIKLVKLIGVNSLYVYIAQMAFFRIIGYAHWHIDYANIFSHVILFAMSLVLSWIFVYAGMIGTRIPIVGPLFWGK